MMHISSSLPGGGTSPKSDKIVWSRERGGGIGVEVCRLQLHLFILEKMGTKVKIVCTDTWQLPVAERFFQDAASVC